MSMLNNLNSFSDINYEAVINTNATTPVTTRNSYVTSITLLVTAGGTSSSITIEDGQTTPQVLVDALATTAVGTTPTILSFGEQGILFTNGIKIVTNGTAAATVSVWIQGYY
jgi:hypothetical protein